MGYLYTSSVVMTTPSPFSTPILYPSDTLSPNQSPSFLNTYSLPPCSPVPPSLPRVLPPPTESDLLYGKTDPTI